MMRWLTPALFGIVFFISIIIWTMHRLERMLFNELARSRDNLQSLNDALDERVRIRTGELEQATLKAETASRAKSEFLSRMSHELRTPLNATLGFAQILELEKNKFTPMQQDSIQQIINSGQHLLKIINEILDMSRIEAGRLELNMQPVKIMEVIHDTVNLTIPLALNNDISITSDDCEINTAILADPTRIKQVILNLLSNAIKYSHQHGRINLHCSLPENHTFRLEITDEGPGIPPDKFDVIFDPFERITTGNKEGTGIGLAVCHKLVHAMHGDIGVHNNPGQGCTFWIEIPLVT
jgi:signal transduction histidine kinase